MNIIKVLDRPIAFQRPLVDLVGSITGALFLSQAIYWQNRAAEDGWWWKTAEQWKEETGMTRSELETARAACIKAGLLQVSRSGMPCRTFYRVNAEALQKSLELLGGQDCNKAANKAGPSKQSTNKESNAEITSKEGGASALALGAGLPPSGSGGVDPTGGQGSPEGEAFSLSAPPQVAPPSPFVAFKTGWFDRFKLRTGEKYDFKVADGVALKRMLDSNSAESLLNLVDRCEDAPNDSAHWSCKRALETVAKFSSLLNSVRCELAAKPMTRPVVRSVPEPHAIREEVAVPVMRF